MAAKRKQSAFGKKSAFAKKSVFGVHTVGANITYYQHIKPLFTQWDQVQMANNLDVGSGQFDLWSYEQVKDKAKLILTVLQDGRMPKYIGPWSDQDINLFTTWMDNGFVEGTPPKTPEIPKCSDLFISLSEKLTGFDDLPAVLAQIKAPTNPDLASIYFYRLRTESAAGARVDELMTACADDVPVEGIVKDFPVLVADINRLWYGAYIHILQDGKIVPYFGTPEFNQYRYALVWINGGAHPMGYATYADNTKNNPPGQTDFYWAHEPSDPDNETGLFTNNTGY